MMKPESLLAMLHLADSAFPSGGFAFSWGLESLVADGLVTNQQDLLALIEDLLINRWRTFDRTVLARVNAIEDMVEQVEQLLTIDLEIEAATWPAPLRAGSKRAGRALLNVHAQLGSAEVRAYRARVLCEPRSGHLAVAQGVAWRASGIGLDEAQVMAVWTSAAAVASAGVRLGIVGHLGAQTVLAQARNLAAEVLRDVADPDAPLSAFTPLVDIALMRHERRSPRLFAT
jgi:urease accessory protein